MHIVCSTLPFRKYNLKEALRRLSRLGFNTVELCMDSLHSDPRCWDDDPEETLKVLHRLEMKVDSIHVPRKEEKNFTPDHHAFRKALIEQSVKAIDTAVLLGAGFIVQHVFLMADSSDLIQGNLLRNTVPHLEEVVRYATVKKVKVAIENVPSSSFRMFGKSIQEIIALIRLLPPETAGLCLDVNHCLACGLDPMEVLTAIEVSRLISIHASDNLSSPLADRHLSIGAGDIPWERMFKDLRALDFQGSFIIEVVEEKALIDSINHLRSLDVQDSAISVPATNPNRDLNSIKGGERRRKT